MSDEMQRIRDAANKALYVIQKAAPMDTGNLRKSIKIQFQPRAITIYVSVGDGVTSRRGSRRPDGMAPYMKYTNEPWSNFKEPLNGKSNPNEGWFDKAAADAAREIAAMLKGRII